MNGELLFLIAFLVIFLSGAIIRSYYSRYIHDRKLSPRERMRQSIANEGKALFGLLTFQGFFLWFALMSYLLNFFGPWFLWAQLSLPEWVRWIGVLFGAISLPFLVWVQHTIGCQWTISLGVQQEHVLVTTGPYSRIRHPMYTVHIFYFLAFGLVTANIFFFINWLLTLILIFGRMPREEAMMLNEFGEEYRSYMKRTGRLFPRLRYNEATDEPISQKSRD